MDKNFNSLCDSLVSLIEGSSRILLTTHYNPDGDGLGASQAFFHYLNDIGKDVRIIVDSTVSHPYDTLDITSDVEVYNTDSDAPWCVDVDLVIVFDIGDLKRIGRVYDVVSRESVKTVSIDHHPPRNNDLVDLDIIYHEAPATGYIVWKYLNSISIYDQGYPVKIADPLYMSLVTDTGSFKYSNTTSDAHIMAADLIDSGVKGYEIQRSIYEQQKLVSIILLANVVQRLKHSENMKAVWTIITQSMLNEIGATQNDIDGVTEYIRSIKDVEISFMILELSDGSFRINFRSSGNYSVNDIAEIFKGGGHKFAAGARLDDSYDISRIESIIIEKINEKIPGEINVN